MLARTILFFSSHEIRNLGSLSHSLNCPCPYMNYSAFPVFVMFEHEVSPCGDLLSGCKLGFEEVIGSFY